MPRCLQGVQPAVVAAMPRSGFLNTLSQVSADYRGENLPRFIFTLRHRHPHHGAFQLPCVPTPQRIAHQQGPAAPSEGSGNGVL